MSTHAANPFFGCGCALVNLPNNFFAAVLFVGFSLDDFTATVVARRADVVAQMRFTSRWLHSERRVGQKIVRAMHTALGW